VSDLQQGRSDVPYSVITVDGEYTTTIPAIEADWCPACGEGVMDGPAADKYLNAAREFRVKLTQTQTPHPPPGSIYRPV
jgi:YgiT-type zinc finger domain-containing protein